MAGNKGDTAVAEAKLSDASARQEGANQTEDKLREGIYSDPGKSPQTPENTVGTTLGGYAYKLAERALLSEQLDGAADVASSMWRNVQSEWSALTGQGSAGGLQPEFIVKDNRAILPATTAPKPEGQLTGQCDKNSSMEVSVYVKSKATDLSLDREIQRINEGLSGFLTAEQFEKKFGANPDSIAELKKFAADSGLKVGEIDMRSGRVVLSGKVGQFNEAFGTTIQQYKQADGKVLRSREGALSVPKGLAPHIDGIFGLDERAQATTHFVKLRDPEPEVSGVAQPRAAGHEPKPMMPTEIAELYKFPTATTGKGQGIAIIELGGNPNPDDYAKYYAAHGLKTPKLNIIAIDGAKPTPGTESPANGELALDAQVIGAVAPDAVQNMIMAPNNDRGFVDAIERAAFPKTGEVENQSISISWGQKESSWSQQGFKEMDNIFKKAYIRGIGVYAASGDDGAKDRSWWSYQADFPASDPYVTGTGGTRLIGEHGQIVSETVWNNGKKKGSGGGGISQQWPVPDYQKDVKLPENANHTHKPGRGVPDVAGDADPRSGYIIRVDGKEGSIGGTSAVAPLYAALHARLAEGVGGGKPTMIGNLNPFFYKSGEKGGFFNDITEGNNNGYNAGPGWDAATGWGTVKDGNKMLESLKAYLANHKVGG